MKCILYIPPFECEGVQVNNISQVLIGGLTLYQRACRCIQTAKFNEIIVAKPSTLDCPDDRLITIPVRKLSYATRVKENSEEILKLCGEETEVCVCQLDGMVSTPCFTMRPHGADVRILVSGEHANIFFVGWKTISDILSNGGSLDEIDGAVSEDFNADDSAFYHRVMSSDDLEPAQEVLTRSLKKPLGRDADGLVAYFINRPCSLKISKHLANSSVTPNMVTAFGLLLGILAAVLMFVGYKGSLWLTAVSVILWQISSIVDGIDGELARMRMTPSHKGEWFDTVADDVTNIGFMFGLGHFMFMLTGIKLYYHVAAVVCGLMVVVVCWFYIEFIKLGIASHNHFEWGFEKENRENKTQEQRGAFRRIVDSIAGGFAWIAKRDFYTFLIMCLVLCGFVTQWQGFYTASFFIMLTGATFVGVGGLIALSIRAIRNLRKK